MLAKYDRIEYNCGPKQLKEFKKSVDSRMKSKNLQKDEAIFQVLKEYIVSSKDIRFEGNGYSEEWVKEAKKRGLSNQKTTPYAPRCIRE